MNNIKVFIHAYILCNINTKSINVLTPINSTIYRDSYRILGWGGDSTPRGVWGHVPPGNIFEKLML